MLADVLALDVPCVESAVVHAGASMLAHVTVSDVVRLC
jgi:hypothetical protein